MVFGGQLHAPAVFLRCYNYWIGSRPALRAEMVFFFFCKGKFCYCIGNRTAARGVVTALRSKEWIGCSEGIWSHSAEWGSSKLGWKAVDLWRRQSLAKTNCCVCDLAKSFVVFPFLCSNVIHWQKLWESFPSIASVHLFVVKGVGESVLILLSHLQCWLLTHRNG